MCRVKKRTKETDLNICSWNVGGLISENHDKTKDPLFIKHINEFDLILLTEIHLGYENIVDIEGFFYYPFCREKSRNNRYFGGIGILIKKKH